MTDLTRFIGLPYADCGRGPAFDCWGFVMHVSLAAFGRALPDYRYLSSSDTVEAAWTIFDALSEDRWRLVHDRQPGDVLIFRVGRFSCHCGIVASPEDFLHCLAGRASTMERQEDWARQIISTRRLIE